MSRLNLSNRRVFLLLHLRHLQIVKLEWMKLCQKKSKMRKQRSCQQVWSEAVLLLWSYLSVETVVMYTLIVILVTGGVCVAIYYVPWVYLIENFFIETESLGAWGYGNFLCNNTFSLWNRNFLLIFGFVVISFPFTFGYIPLSLGAGKSMHGNPFANVITLWRLSIWSVNGDHNINRR